MSGEKTEQPTPKKLRDARKKGQVSHSKETVSAILIVSLFVYFWFSVGSILETIQTMLVTPPQFYNEEFLVALMVISERIFNMSIGILAQIIFLVIVMGMGSNIFQVGFLFTLHPLKPELSKLSPEKGFKKIFSLKNLMEFVKSTIKILVLGGLIFFVVKNAIQYLVILPSCGMSCVGSLVKSILGVFLFYTAVAFVVIAIWDFWFQGRQHTNQLKMSKDEVKREYKEMEGDPIIKSKRRSIHQSMLDENLDDKVQDSAVVVTNPTHLAVCLQYDFDAKKKTLPIISAKGEGYVAARIVKLAQKHDVPIMQHVNLARSMFIDGKLGHFIPSALIGPTAMVLQWVNHHRKKKN